MNFIQRSAAELTELVDDLLDLAKVEAGKIDVKPRHFEVQDLFGALRGMLKPLLIGNSLELIFDAEPNLPILYTDEGKVSQILRNLISNALKFTRRGHVRLTAHLDEGNLIVFRVADTGIGIAPEDRRESSRNSFRSRARCRPGSKEPDWDSLCRNVWPRCLADLSAWRANWGLAQPSRFSSPFISVRLRLVLLMQLPTRTPMRRDRPFSLLRTIRKPASSTSLPEDEPISSRLRDERSRSTRRDESLHACAVALDRFLDGEDSLFYIQEMKANGSPAQSS